MSNKSPPLKRESKAKRNTFLILMIILIYKTNSQQYFKAIYIGNNYYYLIFTGGFNYYKIGSNKSLYSFSSDQKIQSQGELNMINFGKFVTDLTKDNILIVKNYAYYVLDGDYTENEKLNNIGDYPSELVALKCDTITCFFIVGIINNQKQIYLYLNKKKSSVSFIDNNPLASLTINNVESENLSCHLMISTSEGEVLTCFYQNDSKEIVTSSFKIDTSNKKITPVESLTKSKTTNGAKIIKSNISEDKTKSYICYINDENNCDCLTYDINTNEFGDSTTYLYNCLANIYSLNFVYYEKSYEFFLYCFQSSEKFSLVKLNKNFEKLNVKYNGIYDLENYLKERCTNYYISTLAYSASQIIVLINCDSQLVKKVIEDDELPSIDDVPTTITVVSSLPISTELTISTTNTIEIPSTTSHFEDSTQMILPISSTIIINDYHYPDIIQMYSDKTLEEIIENIDGVMGEYDIGKIYEVFGNNYNVKINPINLNIYKNISTYIDFSTCEKILRDENKMNSSSLLTVYLIEILNEYEKSLINSVEYAVFNEEKKRLDLSACKEDKIKIHYELNLSSVNIEKVKYYSDLGIDIFNIDDDFFNDICFSYSENNSDMILNDRVNEIYENYSLCENNCKYEKINLTENMVTCKCSVKASLTQIVEPPKLDIIIRDSLEDSNIGVLKCYNLVFSFINKNKNIGFLLFTILVLLHFPIFIHYFIHSINPIKIFIFNEMKKYHYLYGNSNPTKNNKNEKSNKNNKNDKSKQRDEINKNDKNNKKSKNNKNNKNKKDDNKPKKDKTNFNKIIFKNYEKKIINNYNKIEIFSKNNLLNEKDITSSEFYKKYLQKSSSNLKMSESIKPNQKKNPKRYKLLGKQLVFLSKLKSNKNNTSKKNNESNKILKKCEKKNDNKGPDKNNYYLIQIDANNSSSKVVPPNSNIILDNYDFEQAIKYDKRNFCKLFNICILGKDNIVNIIFFKTPLDLQSLRICNFIFSISCDLALNSIFYTNQSISDKYHYKGKNLFFFIIINNSIQSIISSLVGLVLVDAFQHLFDYRGNFEDVFKTEEKKLRNNKSYKVNKPTKHKIFEKITNNFIKLKRKVIIYIVFEFLLMLFFYYFVSAFCEVYKMTQISWLLDFLSSIIISFISGIIESFIIAISYLISLKYKVKFLYNISLFFYSI